MRLVSHAGRAIDPEARGNDSYSPRALGLRVSVPRTGFDFLLHFDSTKKKKKKRKKRKRESQKSAVSKGNDFVY
jgi:hypothetical protein